MSHFSSNRPSTSPQRVKSSPKAFEVQTDSSYYDIGASLDQGSHAIAFVSKKLIPSQSRYVDQEKERYAIIYTLKTWRHYLYGN